MPRSIHWAQLFTDAAAIALAFYLAHLLRFTSGLIPAPLGHIPLLDWLALAGLSLPLWLLVSALHGLYYARLKQAAAAELGALTHSVTEGLLATILLTFAVRGLPDSRLALLLTVAIAWLLLAGTRAVRRRCFSRKPLAVVAGTSPLAMYLRRQLEDGRLRYRAGQLVDSPAQLGDAALSGADAVFCDAQLAEELWQRAGDGVPRFSAYLLPQAGSEGVAALQVASVEGVPALAVKSASDLAMMRATKRAVDIVGALVLIVLSSPFWLLAIFGILITMPGPILFSHERLGLFGTKFRLLKFRSMVRDAHKLQVDLEGFDDKMKLKRDPRITPWGRLLRKLSLDELPQLINILRGELSLVGPRPIVVAELEKYGQWGSLLLTVPPGLTGLWQVSGRSDTTYQQRIDFDLYYINNWSLGLDLLIMARTIPAVLSRKGAY